MKIIDKTPFYNPDTGVISLVDRVRATFKYGSGWTADIEAQKSVLNLLEKVLDKNYTLLRNIVLADLDAIIPFILIGPPGVYVMYVTALQGTYRAKGDQWGTISGSNFKIEKPNLLTRTEHMARAVQVYLQRQGYLNISGVEAVLLCADPGVHIDSLRPIVRVVMRDALERFTVSISQARLVLTPEAVHDIANRIVNPPKPAPPQPLAQVAAAAAASAPAADSSPSVPAGRLGKIAEPPITDLQLPQAQSTPGAPEPWSPDRLGFDFVEGVTQPPKAEPSAQNLPAQQQAETGALPDAQLEAEAVPLADTQPKPQALKKRGLTRRQLVLLIVFAIIEILLLAVFAFLVIRNYL